jgi:hypothetical protein
MQILAVLYFLAAGIFFGICIAGYYADKAKNSNQNKKDGQ